MGARESMEALFREYLDDVDLQNSKYRPTDGIFGMGNGIRNDPCHDRFDEKLEALMAQLRTAPLSREEALDAIHFLFGAEKMLRKVECARWMLIAEQRHVLTLLPLVTPEDASALLADYQQRYPKRNRLPVQDEIVKALKKRAG